MLKVKIEKMNSAETFAGGTGDLIVPAVLLPAEIDMCQEDRAILRELAADVAELAQRPIELEKRDHWRRHNMLERVRPIIYVSPENAWNEVFPRASLRCLAPLAREWEMRLRQQRFYGRDMGDDYAVIPHFGVEYVHQEPDWGLAVERVGDVANGAFTWIPPVACAEDIEKLHAPIVRIDYGATKRLAALAQEIFGDVLSVRVVSRWPGSVGLTRTLVDLRGMEQVMYDMIEAPDMLHRLMTVLHDGTAALLDALEEAHLVDLNNDGSYVGSGGQGWTGALPGPDYSGVVRLCDQWGFADNQETVGISPRMFEQFIFPYVVPLLDRFGLNCYGCCEPLEKRWRIVQQGPRLRRISVPPVSDREKMASLLEDRYIYSMKPNPTDLAMTTFDEARIRQDIRRDLEVTKDCCLEIIMKDTHTVRGDPSRLVRWVRIVREEVDAIWH
jgi:hypothetical protein